MLSMLATPSLQIFQALWDEAAASVANLHAMVLNVDLRKVRALAAGLGILLGTTNAS